MTTATIESISPDPWLAQGFYQRANEFLRDGQNTELSAAGRQVLLHSAALAACDAVLAINGRQVVGSEGGHVLRLTEAERLLGDDLGDLSSAWTMLGQCEPTPRITAHSSPPLSLTLLLRQCSSSSSMHECTSSPVCQITCRSSGM